MYIRKVKMKKIYILLTKSETVLSKLVHLITADTYTHASIAFEENMKTLYSSSRKNGRTLFPAGPCQEYLHRGYFEKNPHIPCAVYELHVSDEVYEKAKLEVEQIMAESNRYNFNILGLMLCHFNIPHHREYYFFCSQFVGEILHRSQAMTLPKDTSLMRPSDYMYLPELFCSFRGCLSQLIVSRCE
jgi:inositol transport system substrate-binding protein